MKKPLLIVTVLAAVLFFSACTKNTTTTTEVKKEEVLSPEAQAEADRMAQENSIIDSEYQIFKDRSEIKIKENEIKIEKLKQRIAKEDRNTQERLNKRIDEIEAKNTRIKEKLANYKQTGTAEWNAFKRELDYDMEELGEALKGLTEDNKP